MSDNNEVELRQKQNWLEKYASQRSDLFFPETWPENDRAEAMRMVTPEKTRVSMIESIPLKCRGDKCEIRQSCPLYAKNKHPLGDPCPIELGLVLELMESLRIELDVDPENLSEVSMIRDLANFEIQQLRVSKVLSYENFIQDTVIGINERTGEPILKRDLHPAINFEDKILKKKAEVRKQLLATREAKAKVGIHAIDSAQRLAEVFYDLREDEIQARKLLNKKLGRIEKDDYIEDAILVEDTSDNADT